MGIQAGVAHLLWLVTWLCSICHPWVESERGILENKLYKYNCAKADVSLQCYTQQAGSWRLCQVGAGKRNRIIGEVLKESDAAMLFWIFWRGFFPPALPGHAVLLTEVASQQMYSEEHPVTAWSLRSFQAVGIFFFLNKSRWRKMLEVQTFLIVPDLALSYQFCVIFLAEIFLSNSTRPGYNKKMQQNSCFSPFTVSAGPRY